MKQNLFKFIVTTGLAAIILSGCTGNEVVPDTQTKQTAAATGAVAGAVIGYNASGHHRGRNAVLGSLLGAAVGSGVGSAIEGQDPQPQETGGWQ